MLKKAVQQGRSERRDEALKHAYHGELDLHYDQDEQFVRVTWTR